MTLINDMMRICNRLASHGWRELLLEVTSQELDIVQPTEEKLQHALTRYLHTIHRDMKGFEDFHPAACQAITPSRPSHSLLYHALASPYVHPTTDSEPSEDGQAYPDLTELEVVENYIYSLTKNLEIPKDSFVAVFAYQYRVGSRSAHGQYADMTYSRTGIARVGTAIYNYDPSRRSFWVKPKNGTDEIAVLPARYGVFLARRGVSRAGCSVMSTNKIYRKGEFVFPIHKLFDGPECIKGLDLRIDYKELHRNEKLKNAHRLHTSEGGLETPPGFDPSSYPYVRDSNNDPGLVKLQTIGSTVLVVPQKNKTLVRTVSQKNTESSRQEIIYFTVPKETQIKRKPFSLSSRFGKSTLRIPPFRDNRIAPEYISIQHQVDPQGAATQITKRLASLKDSKFKKKIKTGQYPAAHFSDDTCDGCIEAIVHGLPPKIGREHLLAFSLITAPDFFPLADQFQIAQELAVKRLRPLSRSRMAANNTLTRPSQPNLPSFSPREQNITAVVGPFTSLSGLVVPYRPNRMISFLPDAASAVYAPGWDTSRGPGVLKDYLTTWGLGSPFVEDIKICAALSSFWPAASPDSSRSYGNGKIPGFPKRLDNSWPMLDDELGFHPEHELVRAGQVKSYHGWDGEYGPFFEDINQGKYVNYLVFERSDYVQNALDGKIRISLTCDVQSKDLIARYHAVEACEALLVPKRAHFCLVVFRKIDNWSQVKGTIPAVMEGGFLLQYAEMGKKVIKTTDIKRVRKEVKQIHTFLFGSNGLAYKKEDKGFLFYCH